MRHSVLPCIHRTILEKRDYEKAGVTEYVVLALRMGKVFWFVRQRGKYKELPLLCLGPAGRRNRGRVRAIGVPMTEIRGRISEITRALTSSEL